LSKLAWAVQLHARRMQVRERLTTQVADWLVDNLRPAGVAVRVRAQHMCMSLRGVRTPGAVTFTHAARGALADDPDLRQQWWTHLSADVLAGC
jgi:GTP cyclohydrolase IA